MGPYRWIVEYQGTGLLSLDGHVQGVFEIRIAINTQRDAMVRDNGDWIEPYDDKIYLPSVWAGIIMAAE